MNELQRLIESLYGLQTKGMSDDAMKSLLRDGGVMQREAGGLAGPESIDVKKRSVEVVITTEDPARVIDWDRWEVVDEVLMMEGLRMKDIRKGKLPLLDGHNRQSSRDVLGSTVDLRIDGDKLLGREVWSTKAEDQFVKTTEGHLDQRSVGYQRYAVTYIEPGETGVVNGWTFTAKANRGLEVVTDWIAVEESVTPIGADPRAGTRTAVNSAKAKPGDHETETEDETMDKHLKQLLVAQGMKAEATEEEAWAFFAERAAGTSGTAGGSGRSQSGTDPEEPSLAERNAAILDVFEPFLAREGTDKIQAACIREAVAVDVARQRLVEHLAAKTQNVPNTNVTVTQDEGDKRRENMVAGLSLRAEAGGALNLIPKDKRDEYRERGGDFANMSLFRMAEECLGLHGINTRRMSKMDLVARAFTHATGDFPYALENTAHKSLLGAYQDAPKSWDVWCQRGSLSDFKTASIVKMGEFSILSNVPEGAEYPFTTMDEDKETIYLLTYGDMFSITRQAVINDDLSVFTDVPVKFGRAWGRTVNRLPVVALLANGAMNDTYNLFSTEHKNNLTGGTYAPTSVAYCQAAIRELTKLFRAQTDINSEVKLDIQPRIVLAGPTGEYYWSQALFESGLADNNTNVFIRRLGLSLAIEPELENANITGYSTTASYMFASPADAPVMRVAFLDGNDAPRLESERGWYVDGTEFKVSGDVGVGKVDHRGAARSVGA